RYTRHWNKGNSTWGRFGWPVLKLFAQTPIRLLGPFLDRPENPPCRYIEIPMRCKRKHYSEGTWMISGTAPGFVDNVRSDPYLWQPHNSPDPDKPLPGCKGHRGRPESFSKSFDISRLQVESYP